ncbi:MAG: glutaredoxin [Motiliproteus sp.]|nr:glutaredoxin [Motiliproteus sp.]MCW9053168.1 glutaredoxin [Motiliproteus sp.]
MTTKRKVEIFTAGCAICSDVIEEVKQMACSSCEIIVVDMHEDDVAKRAKALGIRSVPAVAVDGKVAACCTNRGIDKSALKAAGIGNPIN